MEDELIVALELEDRLRRQGYTVVGVERSAEAALLTAKRVNVDLALLDLRLAGPRDGVELAVDLRAHGIPSVFLTAHGDEETLRRIKSVEAQGYLLKPFDERLLRLTIETALHRHTAERGRLEAERARQRSEAIQATILRHSPDAVLVARPDGTIELANRMADAMFRLPHAFHELDLRSLLPSFDVEQLDTDAELPWRGTGRRHDQEEFPAEVRVGAVALSEGERRVLIVRDLTRQQTLERELERARQLEIVGRLASGVAHDLNNLLSVVAMTTFVLPNCASGEVPELVDDLDTAVDLGRALTARLLAIARQGRAWEAPRELHINTALSELERLIRRSLGGGVELVLELDPRVELITVGESAFAQIVLNLTFNANRAMPEGGQLTLRTRLAQGGEHVCIEVVDTGVGMDADVQRHALEPFFTTRAERGGTGIGLAIVNELVVGAGGTLQFHSQPGCGTTFCVCFPHSFESGAPADPEQPSSSRAAASANHTILVVDDDALHRRGLVRMLNSYGYATIEANGAGEAMLIVERESQPLALALLDVNMPYMSGVELSARLVALRPGLPVLLLSGKDHLAEHGAAHGLLVKPLAPTTVLAEVARALGQE